MLIARQANRGELGAAFLCNIGMIRKELGKFTEALMSFKQANSIAR